MSRASYFFEQNFRNSTLPWRFVFCLLSRCSLVNIVAPIENLSSESIYFQLSAVSETILLTTGNEADL